MATASKHQYDDVRFLGGLFVELEQIWQNADYQPLLAEEIPRLEKSHEAVFQNEKSPGGEAWKELSPVTIARKGHDVILHLTGALGTSLFGQTGDSIRDVGDRHLTFGTSDFKSIFHTEGTSRMPAREHVGVNDEQVDGMVERVADFTVELLKG